MTIHYSHTIRYGSLIRVDSAVKGEASHLAARQCLGDTYVHLFVYCVSARTGVIAMYISGRKTTPSGDLSAHERAERDRLTCGKYVRRLRHYDHLSLS